MPATPIPLIILGGSDPQAAVLPPAGREHHPLVGYKAVDVRIGGRPLVAVLIERLEQCGAFDPIVIAGPERLYREAGITSPVVDTDGSFGRNVRTGVEKLRKQHRGRQLGMTTCDILPRVDELNAQLEDYYSEAPYDFWYPMIRAPEDPQKLGPSDWKPKYRIIPEPGEEPVLILPNHLVIFDPDALRRKFLYHVVQLGYSSRNRPIAYRRSYMLRQIIWGLLVQDVRHVLGFRIPNLTWTVVSYGVATARKLREGLLTRAEAEDAVRRIFVKTRHRKRFPERRVSMPVLEGLSLAEDIDTIEEAQAKGGTRAEA